MSAVVDASLLVAGLTDAGPEGTWAETVLERGGLAAPQLVLVETLDVLRRRELAGSLSRLEAGAAARDLMLLDVELLPLGPFAARVWELRASLTSHDAWYVAAAEGLDLPLATLDRRLAAALGPRCPFLLPPG